MKTRIRVAGLAINNDSILLVKHTVNGEHFWIPPGGGLEGYETFEECAARETIEETGLVVRVGTLAYVTQYIDQKNQWNQVSFLFLSQTIEGTPKAQSEWGKSNEWIEDIVWLGEDELEGKFVISPFI